MWSDRWGGLVAITVNRYSWAPPLLSVFCHQGEKAIAYSESYNIPPVESSSSFITSCVCAWVRERERELVSGFPWNRFRSIINKSFEFGFRFGTVCLSFPCSISVCPTDHHRPRPSFSRLPIFHFGERLGFLSTHHFGTQSLLIPIEHSSSGFWSSVVVLLLGLSSSDWSSDRVFTVLVCNVGICSNGAWPLWSPWGEHCWFVFSLIWFLCYIP